MDKKIRSLEREFQSNPSLESAEQLVLEKLRASQMSTLIPVDCGLFKEDNWTVLNPYKPNYNLILGLQLPTGLLVKWEAYNKGGLAFVPGIKLQE
ncbi:hypothetical protein C4588_02775 [Candidatus Parcubacteria bacterium]|nr:MAG: hypothetical protein C4588_02775 [Candidatus Parcubacteria bacterium]